MLLATENFVLNDLGVLKTLYFFSKTFAKIIFVDVFPELA